MKVIVGTRYEIEGLEHLTKTGFILSPKHQSTWDTFALVPYLDDPVYILKRELMWIPLFGWYVAKQKMIPINRQARSRAIGEMMERAHQEMENARQLIIYPEGTRRPAGAPPEYRHGIARLYAALGVPVVPVVMHPGLFWPRHKFLRYPGLIKVRILPPIAPGMPSEEFFHHLVRTMEEASDQLLVETVRVNPDVPLPHTARERLEDMKKHGPDA
jgi:1-acyl-sn-glycerol-3-phosphate acyltransferase